MRRFFLALLACTQLVACSEPDPEPQAEVDVLDQLQAIPGANVQEGTSLTAGYRYFIIEFDQPSDHKNADASTHFAQRVLLLHRDVKAPMVLGTSGYFVNPSNARIREPAQLLEANQLWVEQRYFYPSRPDSADWSFLTIEQAANDHHKIVEALRPVYSGKWISAGASKGGMASVYHRRFFPNDVDGTIAYVAPHSSGTSDPRYLSVVANLGDAACQTKLKDFQREVLTRRVAMLDHLYAMSSAHGDTFEILGEEKALETAVLEFVFTFWQYFDATRCAEIPTAASTDAQVWTFLTEICSPSQWSDNQILGFEPYYWQAAVELGYPALEESHLKDLQQFPGLDVPTTYVVGGPGKTPTFNPEAMKDVSNWLNTEGDKMLFVYGETDPYSAAAFEVGNAKDSFKFIAPGKNHSAAILSLSDGDRTVALDALARWTGKTPVIPTAQPISTPLAPHWDRW